MEPAAPTAPRPWARALLSCLPRPQLSPAVLLTLLGSLAASVPSLLRAPGEAEHGLSLEPGRLSPWEVHRLVTYVFYHEDLNSLFCSCLIIWYFGGGFEQSVGTVKHCFLTLVFAVSSALLYLALQAGAAAVGLEKKERVQGFTTVAFAMISAFTINSRLRRVLLLGFMVPTKALPLLFLGVSLFIPHASFLSNFCGILIGIAYGLGGCSFLDLSEPVVTKLDRVFPFSVLRVIPALKYIPGSSAERRASQTRKLNPPPGSYPVQQYYQYPAQGLPPIPTPGQGHNYVPSQHNHGPSQHNHGPPFYPAAMPHGAMPVASAPPAPHGHCCSHTHMNSSPGGYVSGSWVAPGTGHTEAMLHHHTGAPTVEDGLVGVETR